jgi:predicted O-linked N-acetylglucosamine transferase (SPINDLY family)
MLKKEKKMGRPPQIPSRKPQAIKKVSPQDQEIVSLFQKGFKFHQQGQLTQAKAIYEQVLTKQARHFDAIHLLGVIANQTKNPALAAELIEKAIGINTNNAPAYSNRGNALLELKRLDEALVSYDKAIALKPDYAEAFYNRGKVLLELKRHDEALASYDTAIALKPDYAEAFYNRGKALLELKRPDEALSSYDKAISLKPDYAEAFNNRGIALQELKRPDEALGSYDKAIALKTDYAEAFNNRGLALLELKRLDEALVIFDKAISLKLDFVEAFNNSGIALQELKRLDEALARHEKAIALKPDYAEAFYNRSKALLELKRPDDALASYDKAIAIKPDYEFLFGTKLHTQMKLCNWNELSTQLHQLESALVKKCKVTRPFPVLALIDKPELQLLASKIFADAKYPTSRFLGDFRKQEPGEKIRIGYYSADFHDHATAYLMAELFEAHDSQRFELYGFSFGPNTQDEMRKRLSGGFDQFFNVTNKSDHEVVKLSRDLGIDIAVDLKGFTQDSRLGIFAERCAPIQVNYLGYPGTLGASYIDYIVADKTIIPQQSQLHYDEKIVYLPHCYQVNDSKRQISDKAFTRLEHGLPESGFVFCCFNNSYKILPATFDGWMRLLKTVKGSVLWLLEDNPTAAKNLRKEAEIRGVDPCRLVFAKRMGLGGHLARHRLADLFIDTLPYTAHTTASDALWAGLPVLTLMGESFAARVAASLLNAMGLPELITETQAQYESRAIELANSPVELFKLKAKLAQNRQTSPLFNGQLFARHIEAAYTKMNMRYQSGEMPDHIYVDS